MKQRVIDFLRHAWPFLAVLFLWRMNMSFWNPAGILALIPIFYFSFVRPTPWFTPYAVLFCFLIDYGFETTFYWTSMYCLFYALNGFQTFIDLTRAPRAAWDVFAAFLGLCILILVIPNLNWTVLARGLWVFAWLAMLYMPFTIISDRVAKYD